MTNPSPPVPPIADIGEAPITTAAKQAGRDDWIGDPPADDWSRLTFGEQYDYCQRVCRTKGAIYSTHISATEISVKVELPPSLAIRGLTEQHAKQLERDIHNRMERAIVEALANRETLLGYSVDYGKPRP